MPNCEKETMRELMKGVKEVIIRGPIFISKEDLANLEKFIAKAPREKCHMKITVKPDGTIVYHCTGSCPPGEGCAIDWDTKKGEISFSCACKK